MSELETGWNLSRIESYLEHNLSDASAFLEHMSDDEGIALWLALTFSIRSGIFVDEKRMQAAIRMWGELNKVFGKVE